MQDVKKIFWGDSERSQCKCLLQQAETEADMLWEDQNGENPKMDLLRLGEKIQLWQEANELEVLIWREADERLRSSQIMDWAWGSIRC